MNARFSKYFEINFVSRLCTDKLKRGVELHRTTFLDWTHRITRTISKKVLKKLQLLFIDRQMLNIINKSIWSEVINMRGLVYAIRSCKNSNYIYEEVRTVINMIGKRQKYTNWIE